MAKTIVHENESIDDALRRFKRSVSRSGTLQEYRKREFYEKPSVRRKLKSKLLVSVDIINMIALVGIFSIQSFFYLKSLQCD